MCQALFSMHIPTATEEKIHSTFVQLQLIVAQFLCGGAKASRPTVDKVAQLVAKPSIRARMAHNCRDRCSGTIMRIHELVAQQRQQNQRRLLEGVWELLNEPELNLALAGHQRAGRIAH